ncbi:hypothetical protein C8J55DRAFT_546863 [Lentinula edodes]|uniref:Uncharacterized protein n=1 Tax=Lentinula lateritia TaxID=40482 RepID=A0A9W9AY13_9AGAR|nr:hypothetical protein C8J55DRAFT_546863 [Lentinula edodes]
MVDSGETVKFGGKACEVWVYASPSAPSENDKAHGPGGSNAALASCRANDLIVTDFQSYTRALHIEVPCKEVQLRTTGKKYRKLEKFAAASFEDISCDTSESPTVLDHPDKGAIHKQRNPDLQSLIHAPSHVLHLQNLDEAPGLGGAFHSINSTKSSESKGTDWTALEKALSSKRTSETGQNLKNPFGEGLFRAVK